MTSSIRLTTWALVILVVTNSILASKLVKRAIEGDSALSPLSQAELEESFGGEPDERSEREKRLIIKKIGLKAVLLNLIFGKIDQLIDWKTRQINQLDKQNIEKNRKYFGITPPPKRPANSGASSSSSSSSSNGDISVFPTNTPVSLDIPGELYGNSFGLVTNMSEIVGNVLFNSAARAQEFVDRAQQIVRNKFGFTTRFIRTTGPSKRNVEKTEDDISHNTAK